MIVHCQEADIDNVWFVAKFGSAPYPVKDFSYNDGCAGPRVFVYTYVLPIGT